MIWNFCLNSKKSVRGQMAAKFFCRAIKILFFELAGSQNVDLELSDVSFGRLSDALPVVIFLVTKLRIL